MRRNDHDHNSRQADCGHSPDDSFTWVLSGLDFTGTLFGLLTAALITGQYISNRLVARDNPLATLP